MAHVISEECIKCAACEAECPVNAISEGDNQYVIDPDTCIDVQLVQMSARLVPSVRLNFSCILLYLTRKSRSPAFLFICRSLCYVHGSLHK